jgi:hypothetical protein
MNGTPKRNADPHQKRSSNIPPTSGPRAIPPIKQLIHTPMAVPICLGSSNMFRIRAMVEGISVAPATPRIARAAMSICALVE